MIAALRALAGDALIALGKTIRRSGDGWAAPEHLLDGGWAAPAITPAEARQALDELPDSELLNIAATVVAGFKPMMPATPLGRAAAVDVDVLVEALRDRASQFRAVELDADQPFPSARPGAPLNDSPRIRGE